MSDLFVDNIKHQSSQGSGTITLGASGESVNVPSGTTLNVSGTPGTGIRMKPFFKVYKSANTDLSNAVETLTIHNLVIYDDDNVYDNSAGNFTVPTGEGGYYFFTATTRFTCSTGLAFRDSRIRLYLNDTAYEYTNHSYTNSSSTGNFNNDQVTILTTMELNAGDKVEVYSYLRVTGGVPKIVGSTHLGGAVTRFEGFKLIGV